MASSTQLQMLKIIPRVTGSLSILGSTFIIYDVVKVKTARNKNKTKNTGKVIDRFLIGMSACDILASVSNPVILNLALPEKFGGKGNQATCNAQGFFSQFVTATALYSGCMALTYLLSIKYGWNELQLWQCVERIAHVLIFTFVVVSGTASIFLELYNPTPLSCTMVEFPFGCGGEETPPCIRGESAPFWRLPFRTIPEYVAITFAVIAMTMIYCSVRGTEERARRWDSVAGFRSTDHSAALPFSLPPPPPAALQEESMEITPQQIPNDDAEHSTCNSSEIPRSSSSPALSGGEHDTEAAGHDGAGANSSSKRISTMPTPQSNNNHHARRLSREVGIQGIYFICAFVATWTVPTIARSLARIGGRTLGIEWFIAINFFLPLQGFFNFLVYVRPRILKSPWQRRAASSEERSSGGASSS
jgi:hypothetical protein